jgi:hypothetical protein
MDSAGSYSGVVGMETIGLGFLLAEMNGLKICATEIGSAICKHKCVLASMFYQNIGPSSVHVFHMY